jgi:Hemerythrin HHE cation binding domain
MSHEHLLQHRALNTSGRAQSSAPEAAMSPGEVRTFILRQHARIRELLDGVEQAANRLLASAVPNAAACDATRLLTLQLCSTMEAHIELENDILVGALATIDAWGLVRGEHLRQEHAEQLSLVSAYASELREGTTTGSVLGLTASRLVALIRADMAHEEESVLSAGLLSDGLVAGEVETG